MRNEREARRTRVRSAHGISAAAISRLLADSVAAGHDVSDLLADAALHYDASVSGVPVEDAYGPSAEGTLESAAKRALERGLPVTADMRDRLAEVVRSSSVLSSSGFDDIEAALLEAFSKNHTKFSRDYTSEEFIDDVFGCNLITDKDGHYEIHVPPVGEAAPLPPLTATTPVPPKVPTTDPQRLPGQS